MGVLLDGRAQETGVRRVGSDSTLLLLLNAHHERVPFRMPEAVGGSLWVRLVATDAPETDAPPSFDFGAAYPLEGNSLCLFILKPEKNRGPITDAERSFQHVLEAFASANDAPVAFPGALGR
jgi:isoamylase